MSFDFILGFICCMVADVVWSFANMMLQIAFKARAERKQIERNK